MVHDHAVVWVLVLVEHCRLALLHGSGLLSRNPGQLRLDHIRNRLALGLICDFLQRSELLSPQF